MKLDAVRECVASLVQRQSLVAVFFGGTSGIGHYALRALATAEAKHKGKGFRAYLVGRKRSRGDEVIAECRQICPEGRITFVQVDDLSLIRDVDKACAEIIRLEEEQGGNDARIDFLMASHGGPVFMPRKDTDEGLDKAMSMMYYSRMRAIIQLRPLLLRSSKPATVVSVYAGGFEEKIYPDNLSLRYPMKYAYLQARSHIVYMHTAFFEALAAENKGRLSLVHVFPGLVIGPGFNDPEYPGWIRLMMKWILFPILGRLVAVEPAECGDRMLSLASPRYAPRSTDKPTVKDGELVRATNGELGGGCYALTSNGEDNFKPKIYAKLDKEKLRQQIVAHTLRAFEVIAAGGVFTE
ncbi:hypothetical protein ASPZODRAFT_128945 [Penicilliopsis zonata CBS 506.65]|uniref:Ketoreductase (KR) domain-containing protein n=1 Tax=Penicilliopsis zonata CBS 506.65 TaxID=1073090 RepID=A0A1L9SSZ9_9EURO|nr:hypothetical protein ASPZODRAFT_128945 [Penicilliopsis zonata CBS 506.65]OJJ50329.1 hypothetical protein ASPZODRAFT_128945 [Penicilliopsis zonata CBS 506.65]